MSSRRSRGETSAWAVICVVALVVGATSCGQVEEQTMIETTVDQTTSNDQTRTQTVSSDQTGSSQTVSNDPTALADSTEPDHSADTATAGDKYGEAISYDCSFGGQILTESDRIRIGISGATDTPKTQATLAVYFRDQSEFDTIQTVDLDVPVDIGGFSIELTAVNMKGRWVAVDIREPLETTD